MLDHRQRPRRRGQALRSAILAAALEELTETGYADLTMERVAERARTGKASVYRLWSNRLELTLEAVRSTFPDLGTAPDTGSLRQDLLGLLEQIAGQLSGPTGEALRGLLSEVLAGSGRIWELRRSTAGTGRRVLVEILHRAIDRGEIDADAVTPRRIEVGQALLQHHFLFERDPIPATVIVEIVDEVLMPLFGVPVPPTRPVRARHAGADDEEPG